MNFIKNNLIIVLILLLISFFMFAIGSTIYDKVHNSYLNNIATTYCHPYKLNKYKEISSNKLEIQCYSDNNLIKENIIDLK